VQQEESQEEDENTTTAQRITDTCTPQQKAMDWLSGVATEDDDVKDIVMQELWRREDFQSA
jgi:hypothetical protein